MTIGAAATIAFVITLCGMTAQGKVMEIANVGAPVLRGIARPLSPAEITSDATKSLIADMAETMAFAGGVGIAAPQPFPVTAFINPILDFSPSYGQEKVAVFEGCLSIPGFRGLTQRYNKIVVESTDVNGKVHHMLATGYVAAILQHEYDHLNGVLYVDKMDPTTFCTSENAAKYFKGIGTKTGTWQWLD